MAFASVKFTTSQGTQTIFRYYFNIPGNAGGDGPEKECWREAADDGMSFLEDMEGTLHGWKWLGHLKLYNMPPSFFGLGKHWEKQGRHEANYKP